MSLGLPSNFLDCIARSRRGDSDALTICVSEDGSIVGFESLGRTPNLLTPLLQSRRLDELCNTLRSMGFSKAFEEVDNLTCEWGVVPGGLGGIDGDIVMRGRDREVILASAQYDEILRYFRLSIRLSPDVIPESVTSSDAHSQSLSALAIALQLTPISFLDLRVFVSCLEAPACVNFLALNDGRSAILDTFDGEKVGAPLLQKLTFHGDRLYRSEDVAQSGLFSHISGRMQISFLDGRSGILNVYRIKSLNEQVALFVGRVTLNQTEIISSFVNSQWPKITDKETEIIALIASGLTIKEVASKLGKSVTTASIQARSALQKTGFRSMNSFLTFVRVMTM